MVNKASQTTKSETHETTKQYENSQQEHEHKSNKQENDKGLKQ